MLAEKHSGRNEEQNFCFIVFHERITSLKRLRQENYSKSV